MTTRKHISRIDQRSTHCWIHRRVINGRNRSKTFSDSVYGSRRKSLLAAKTYDEQLDREYGKLSRKGINLPIGKKANTTNRHSAVAGVSLKTTHRTIGGYVYSYRHWEASWKQDGVSKSQSFSVIKYGYQRAYLLAVKRREKEVRRMLSEGKNLRPSSKKVKRA